MKLEVKETKKNPLLSREEILANLSFQGKTPSRSEVLNLALKEIGSKKDVTIIKKIETEYGVESAKVTIHKYDNIEALKKIEPAHMIKKHGGKDDAKQEAH